MALYEDLNISKDSWIRDDPTIPPNRKTFDLGGGKKRHIVLSRPQHYWTGEGEGERPDRAEWDDIDSTLRLVEVAEKSYPAQYIADKNAFSVGFRSDGSPYKLSGFRLNHANQYETTLHAIELDGKEINLPANLAVSLSGAQAIEHGINDHVCLWNFIHPCFVRDAVKINRFIADFRITYRVHLTGFRVGNTYSESGGIREYIPNQDGNFILTGDASTGNKAVVIPQPVMWTDDTEAEQPSCTEINHRLYEQDGVLYYEKTPNALGRDWLLSTSPTLFIDGTIYYTSSNDGYIYYTNSDWATCRTASAGTSKGDTDNYQVCVEASKSKDYTIRRAFFYFDTSGIDDSHDVTAVDFVFNVVSLNGGGVTAHACSGSQSTPLALDDYDQCGSTSFGSVDCSTSGNKTISFNSSGLSHVSKVGMTLICLRADGDLNNITPSTVANIAINFREGASTDPQLDITTQESSGLLSIPVAMHHYNLLRSA